MKALVLSLGLLSCALAGTQLSAQHSQTKTTLQRDLQLKQAAFPRGGYFDILRQQLSPQERSALEFLYAYMPTNDLMNRSGQYYLDNVRTSLRARSELPWGRLVPEREWRHFVLPLRVNNEALDDFRTQRYRELRDRVRGLDMRAAALEVNHWCHEHINYSPSDARTLSPLATLASATGRCGEESTLLVAALRTVGIPARQVYTPRWAHTDDNHAWVEVWTGDGWHFLGAAEPEPVLDLAWFNAPASRAMLVHTKVFGRYDGPEPVISRTATYTEINVIRGYAAIDSCRLLVTDAAGRALPGTEVAFQLYNYGELYTVARATTDARGYVCFTAGLGDLIAYASRPSRRGFVYGMQQLRFGRDHELRLVLDQSSEHPFVRDFTLSPPPEAARYPEVTTEARQRNDRRLAAEDSMRLSYLEGLKALQLPGLEARSNAPTLRRFVSSAPDSTLALGLLSVLSSKDRRDVTLEVLEDHLLHSQPQPSLAGDSALCMRYIYNPRFGHEPLTPYKAALRAALPQGLQQRFRRSPEALFAWCREQIQLDRRFNPLHYPIAPLEVLRSRRADSHSLRLFALALARTMGWAARLEPVTGKAQYYRAGQWMDIDLERSSAQPQAAQATLSLRYQDNGIVSNPKYYDHFTLSRFDEAGRLSLLSYDEGDNGLEEGSSWRHTFAPGTKLDAGHYLLVSGSRLADGSVLAQVRSIALEPGAKQSDSLVLRRDSAALAVLGQFSSESRYTPLATEGGSAASVASERSLLSSTGRGYYVLGLLDAGSEPARHALRDLSAEAQALDSLGRSIVLLYPEAAARSSYRADELAQLPRLTLQGWDSQRLAAQLIERFKLRPGLWPIFIVADTFDRVVFVTQGYSIGLGRRLVEVLKRLEAQPTPCGSGGCTKP